MLMFQYVEASNLTNEELIRAYRDTENEEARNEYMEILFTKNIRFCHHIAKKYQHDKLDYDDIFGHAQIGMVKAFRLYKFDKGSRFLTFAGLVMHNEILMAFRKAKKLPSYTVSLDEPVVDGDKNTALVQDMVADPRSAFVASLIGQDLLQRVLEVVPTLLTPREQLCFLNLIADEPRTQRAIAAELQVTQSIVSRYTKKASHKIKKFLDEYDKSVVNSYNG